MQTSSDDRYGLHNLIIQSDVYAMAYNSWKNGKQILLVNKLYEPTSVELDGVNGGYITYTDITVGKMRNLSK